MLLGQFLPPGGPGVTKRQKNQFFGPPPGTQNFWFGLFVISLGATLRPQGNKHRLFLYTFFVSLRRRQNHENVDIL